MDLLLPIYLITPHRDPGKADGCMNNMCTFLDVTQSVPGCDYAYSKGECINTRFRCVPGVHKEWDVYSDMSYVLVKIHQTVW